jgi:DNA mismatch endonuclease, patch repair protein
MDIVSPEKRSEMMSGIRSKDTKPEIIIRKALYALGFRYRLHSRNVPGKPDLVLKKYNAVIFIHGCFWHGHSCHLFKLPKTRTEFWKNKIETNQSRDEKVMKELHESGWRVATVWECALRGKNRMDLENLIDNLAQWLLENEETVTFQGRNNES